MTPKDDYRGGWRRVDPKALPEQRVLFTNNLRATLRDGVSMSHLWVGYLHVSDTLHGFSHPDTPVVGWPDEGLTIYNVTHWHPAPAAVEAV